tara:strand:- start:4376 stop:6625 length:2250 start_codon:yes stop_codon:yes gene_type:complete
MENHYLKKLAENGFSIIPCSENKAPSGSWKKYQTKQRTPEEAELLSSPKYGIVTGYNGLEVIDIDLKVFSSLKDRKEFWDEYLGFLKDNIDDFDNKFVVKKTLNKGFHILYRCKTITGNTKIAKLKGHQESIIETRGIGGMVIAYKDTLGSLNYHEIQEITEDDRFVLWSCSKTYNYIEEPIKPVKKEVKEYLGDDTEITCWDDYNEKTDIFDIISSDFSIVANHSKKYVIKRFGAESPHSGYVYKEDNKMYLFSTGTIYPHEQQITPYIAYTYKNHFGDFSASAKDLYQKGYGSRLKSKIKELKKSINIEDEVSVNIDDLVFPIDIYPKEIQNYLLECNTKLDSSVEYMGVSLLWLISVCIGNSIEMEVKKGWTENLSVWISVVGKAGLGKTPSISNIINPLTKINAKEISTYIKEYEKFEYYDSLTKKEKEEHSEVQKPVKAQFIANDITLEALVDLHQESDNSVGVFKDELAGWLKDMNKYREGSDLEFWLSTWSGKSINLNRLTRKGSFVEKPFIPVLGGIQPSIFNTFYTEENKSNGFMDRMLLSYPDLTIDKYNDKEIGDDMLIWYKEAIISFYDTLKSIIKRDEEFNIIPLTAYFSDEAKIEWKRIFNEITDIQNDDGENEYLKSMLPKQKSYIPRFACLIHVFDEFFSEGGNSLCISKESVLKAEKLSKYFVATAKKIKINSVEVSKLKQTISGSKNKNEKEQLKDIWKVNNNFNRSETAELLGVSKRTIFNWVKDFDRAK